MLSHQVVVQPRAVRGPNGDDRGPGAHDHHLGLQRPLAPGKTAFIPFRVFPGPGVPLGRLAAPRGSSTQVGHGGGQQPQEDHHPGATAEAP